MYAIAAICAARVICGICRICAIAAIAAIAAICATSASCAVFTGYAVLARASVLLNLTCVTETKAARWKAGPAPGRLTPSVAHAVVSSQGAPMP